MHAKMTPVTWISCTSKLINLIFIWMGLVWVKLCNRLLCGQNPPILDRCHGLDGRQLQKYKQVNTYKKEQDQNNQKRWIRYIYRATAVNIERVRKPRKCFLLSKVDSYAYMQERYARSIDKVLKTNPSSLIKKWISQNLKAIAGQFPWKTGHWSWV